MASNGDNPETGGNDVRTHLKQLGDASGCTETWIHLSKYRKDNSKKELGGCS